MHDPSTLAFEVKIILPWKTDGLLKSEGRIWARYTLANIWHVDPCKKGNDDSCGWFNRASHGDSEVLDKIVKRIEWDWDRVFKSDSGKTYFCGYFYPEDAGAGMPNMGVSAIVINFMFLAALEHFGSREKATKFCQSNLFEIMLFAENPCDSLRNSIVQKFGNDTKREDRIQQMASCCYGWILRNSQPWYRHARWHVHHWRIQVPLWQRIKRRLFDRCCRCGKGFKSRECVIGNWDGDKIWHEHCEQHPEQKCSSAQS